MLTCDKISERRGPWRRHLPMWHWIPVQAPLCCAVVRALRPFAAARFIVWIEILEVTKWRSNTTPFGSVDPLIRKLDACVGTPAAVPAWSSSRPRKRSISKWWVSDACWVVWVSFCASERATARVIVFTDAHHQIVVILEIGWEWRPLRIRPPLAADARVKRLHCRPAADAGRERADSREECTVAVLVAPTCAFQ
jgi:hypothetical protein